ncbi:unnamed protein product [Trichobilharzia regenti]|nr:unnamed protein product [Trichobilharzia regenti]
MAISHVVEYTHWNIQLKRTRSSVKTTNFSAIFFSKAAVKSHLCRLIVQPIIHPNVTPCTSTIVCEETLDCTTTTTTTADHNLVSSIPPPPRPPTQQPTTSQSLLQPSVEIIKPSLDKVQGEHETGVKPDFKKMTDATDAKHSAETKKSALKQGNVVAEGKADIQVEPLKTSTDDKKVKQRKKMADIQQTPQLLDKRSDFV